jgi:hypothetical protein
LKSRFICASAFAPPLCAGRIVKFTEKQIKFRQNFICFSGHAIACEPDFSGCLAVLASV